MNKTAIAAMSAALAAVAGTNDWENPAVNSRNREPARAYSMPLATVAAALTGDLEPATPFRKSLNGTWKISWCGNPDLRPRDFWKTDFDDADWFAVESVVEERQVRDLIPVLRAAGATGIIELPLNKVIF